MSTQTSQSHSPKKLESEEMAHEGYAYEKNNADIEPPITKRVKVSAPTDWMIIQSTSA